METLSLIDVSAEDDLLLDLASPPAPPPSAYRDPPRAGSLVGAEAASDLEPPAGSQAVEGRQVADPDGVMEEQAPPERTESPKRRKAKTGVNLRKSLAWDSAFFTSEGVLDTEELAIVNSTFRKTQGSRLPGIVEEMRRSGESTTSTLESESWAMESIETELFDNVRASIQRSLGKPDKVPGRPDASSKPPKATANAPRVAARKGIDRMPQIKIRAPGSTSQGLVGGKQRPQASSKEPTAARVTSLGAAEAKPSSKPPRTLPRVATMRSSTTNTAINSGISDKRSSTGGVVNRQAVGKSANTSGSVRPGGVTKSSSISKSGAFTSAATSPFHAVSMDTKTDVKTKSATVGNKNRTAQRIPVRSSSRSDVSKINPSRSSGNKIPARGHADRVSPSISPTSSIDSMSSVISGTSTASTVGKMSHTSESSNPLSSLSPSLRKSNDNHPPTTKLSPPIVTERHSSGTAASGDNGKATADTTNQGKGSKPSGLRRPTPKIGYFDADKSIDQNTGAHVQLQPVKFQCSLPATPKSQPSSTQIMNTASTTFGQQESKSTAAPHEESCASKSKVFPLEVAKMEVEPLKLSEPEVCMHQTGPVVAESEAEKCINGSICAQMQLQRMKIQCSLPDTPKSPPSSTQNINTASSISGQQESKSTAACHEESSASKSKAAMVVEPFKVAEAEAWTGPVVAELEAEESIDQNTRAQVQLQSMKIPCSPPATPKSTPPATPNSQSSSNQTMATASSTFAPEDISASRSNATKAVPLQVAQMEGEPCKVVAEHELRCVHQPSRMVAADASKENIPALHQNIQANGDASSLAVELLTQKLSISLGEAIPYLAL